MNKRIVLSVFLFSSVSFLCAVSCSGTPDKVTVGEGVIADALQLVPDTVGYEPDGAESSVYVIADSMMHVFNNADGVQCRYFHEIFRMRDMSRAGENLPFGPDDNSYLYVMPMVTGNEYLAYDPVKKRVIEPDGQVYDVDYVTMGLVPYRDRALLLNPYYFKDSEGHTNKQPRIAVTDTAYRWGIPEVRYLSVNTTRGTLVANAGKERVMFFDANSSLMEFYSGDLSCPAVMTVGPDIDTVGYTMTPSGDEYETVYLSETPESYYVTAAGDASHVVAVYRHAGDSSADYLFRFDWNGKLSDVYRLTCRVKSISISTSETGVNVYVWKEKEEGDDKIGLLCYTLR